MINITDRGGDVLLNMESGDIYVKKGMLRVGFIDSVVVLYYTKPKERQSLTPLLRVTDMRDVGIISNEAGQILQPSTLEELAKMIMDFFL
jgi:hypothetical protein